MYSYILKCNKVKGNLGTSNKNLELLIDIYWPGCSKNKRTKCKFSILKCRTSPNLDPNKSCPKSELRAVQMNDSHISLFGLTERFSGFCVLTGNVCAVTSLEGNALLVPQGHNQHPDDLYWQLHGAARSWSSATVSRLLTAR